MDKLTAIKIKYEDGTYSDQIPVSVLGENVEWDATHTLVDILGSIDVDITGTIQDQITQLFNSKVNATDLSNYVNSTMKTEVASWLNNYISPATGTIAYDASLSIQGAAADAKAAGQIVQISTTKPTKENNRIWVGTSEEESEVPTMDDIAPAYDSTKTYAVGNIVSYDGSFYKCLIEITTPEAWTAVHWTAATVGTELNDIKGDVTALNEELTSQGEFMGYLPDWYAGGYELGKISSVTGNNNKTNSRVRTASFLDNAHDSLIQISQSVQLQVFEYLIDGMFNNYYVNLVYNSPNITHNALNVSNGVITINKSTQYKYKLNWLYYPNETTISNVDAFISENVSIRYIDVISIPDKLTDIKTDIEKLKNPQINKTWACYGDSITQMDLYEDEVRYMLGITTLYRRGISGCTIAENSASSTIAGDNSSIVYRIVNDINFPNNPDLITILAGINDYYYGSPIGDMNSTGTNTVYGALKAICEKLAMLSYGPKIAFITPTKKVTGQASTALDKTVTQEQVRKAVIDVAGAYGYPVIDLGGICGINPANASRSTNPTTSDGTHWSDVGKALCVPIIADGIRALYQK